MRILLVEDNPADARLVIEQLRFSGPDVVAVDHATTAREGAKLAQQRHYEGALLDLSLPDARGLESLAALRAAAPQLAIVVLTGLADDALALEAVRDGAQDYLVKGHHNGEAIARSIRYAVERQRRAQGAAAVQEEVLRDVRRHLELLESEQQLLRRIVAPVPATRGGPHRLGDRYELVRQLGKGTSAEAWLARDATLGREVCVKIFHPRRNDPDAPRQFAREARLAASLEHPNIVRVYDFGYEGGQPFLVMEYVAAGSLEDLLRHGPLDGREAARVMLGALTGLGHVHAHGLLHRDLKPANVLLANGIVKLADFGLAILQESVAGATQTQSGLAPPALLYGGSPAYMSPEAAAGAPVDARSDIYSAGAMLYHCIAGRPYLQLDGLDAVAARRAILDEEPQRLDGPLAHVALLALEKEPARRPRDAAEMIAMIERVNAAT